MQASMTSVAPLLHCPPADNATRLGPGERSIGAGTTRAAVDSSALLQGQKTVAISHNGALYRLQATKLGKLILTK